ncbi:MAG: GNAT family N-acetyltransferase [Methanoregulaceae archaeon]|nr:GNAT family N-acetyltransferase [Methanoregulaceae archaeon]
MGSDIIPFTKDQIGPASEMLTRAFINDPKLTSILPDEQTRGERGKHLFAFELRYGLNYGRVYTTSPNLEGVAVWLSGDRSEITLWRAMRSGGFALQKALGKEAMKRLTLFSDQVDAYHKKHVPGRHCYLFFIGVDPSFQGRGNGGKLIRPMLDRMDGRGMACYLNTQNEKNISLYEHFGFSVVEQISLPGSGILHTGMIRYPIVREGTSKG